MGTLSLRSYVLKCIIGLEVVYVLCIAGGFLPWRTVAGIELHHTIFETLPGFTWISVGSFIIGAVWMLVFAVIFGWYLVWMHNSSLEKNMG